MERASEEGGLGRRELRERVAELEQRLRDCQDRLGSATEELEAYKQAEARLRDRDRRHHALLETVEIDRSRWVAILESLPVGVWIADREGRIVATNPRADEIWAGEAPLSESVEQYREYPCWWANTRQQVLPEEQPLARALATGERVLDVEFDIERLDGTFGKILASAAPIHNSTGDLIGAVGLAQDIRRRKQAEQELHNERELLQAIYDTVPVMFAVYDPEIQEIVLNQHVERVTGWTPEDTAETGIMELAYPDPDYRAEVADFMQSLTSGFMDIQMRTKDGRVIESSWANVQISDGRQVGIGIDITGRKRAEVALRESEAKFRFAATHMPDTLFFQDSDLRYVWIFNPADPFDVGRVVGKTDADLLPPDEAERLTEIKRRVIETGEGTRVVLQLSPGGIPRWYEAVYEPSRDGEGRRVGVVSYSRDITDRKRAEVALRESEEKYAALFDKSPFAVVLTKMPEGVTVSVNDAFLRLFDYARDEIIGKTGVDLGTSIAEAQAEVAAELAERGYVRDFECTRRTKSGTERMLSLNIDWVTLAGARHWLTTVRDVTDREAANAALRVALQEKETLLRELYHRTKNNMQVIIAMLELQSGYVADVEMVQVLGDMQNRIRSMAMVHQKLYQSNDLSTINLGDYIRELGELLVKSHGVSPDKVKLDFDTDDVFVLIDTAIPCGLVVNEVLNNALIHAFPDGRQGRIHVGVQTNKDEEVVVTVADDGVGVAEGFDFSISGNLGSLIIRMLGERQLRGEIQFDAGEGVSFELRFRDNLYQRRV